MNCEFSLRLTSQPGHAGCDARPVAGVDEPAVGIVVGRVRQGRPGSADLDRDGSVVEQQLRAVAARVGAERGDDDGMRALRERLACVKLAVGRTALRIRYAPRRRSAVDLDRVGAEGRAGRAEEGDLGSGEREVEGGAGRRGDVLGAVEAGAGVCAVGASRVVRLPASAERDEGAEVVEVWR